MQLPCTSIGAASKQLVMCAGSGKRIPELSEIYELAPLMTCDGWERDVRSMEREWLRGSEVDIQREVAKMRRWQCLHDGDRTDAALQVLDAVKQGLTYRGWEKGVRSVERFWARWGEVSHIQEVVAKMRRQQLLHTIDSSVVD